MILKEFFRRETHIFRKEKTAPKRTLNALVVLQLRKKQVPKFQILKVVVTKIQMRKLKTLKDRIKGIITLMRTQLRPQWLNLIQTIILINCRGKTLIQTFIQLSAHYQRKRRNSALSIMTKSFT